MKLLTYIKTLSDEDLRSFSERCGTTVGQIKQVAYGRRASADLAIRVDIASGGKVTCEVIRPDIDWAYLREKPDSPEAA